MGQALFFYQRSEEVIMIRAAIIGATGYTGLELVRILSAHPGITITVATSRQYEGQPLHKVFPSLSGSVDIVCQSPSPERVIGAADVVFLAVPHQTAMTHVPVFLQADKKVIDLSADFRLKDVRVYEKWYQSHSAPEYLAEAAYGLPELHAAAIRKARLVANPGCYPTTVILGLAPLLKKGLIDNKSIVVDSKTGVSGAGRSAVLSSLFCEVHEDVKAYKVAAHRHTPEMEQELSLLAGEEIAITFTPHLAPMGRGMLSTIYADLKGRQTTGDLISEYEEFYNQAPFVKICAEGAYPQTAHVKGSNYCFIGLKADERTGRVIILSAIDNLTKGASGQAVQNMNLMFGLEETTGLTAIPLFP